MGEPAADQDTPPAGERPADPAGLSRGQLDELIQRLRRQRSGATAAAPRRPPARARRQPETGPHELSFAQQRLWFLAQLDAFSPAYHMAGALDLSGPLDRAALGAALHAVVARHEALRTRVGAAHGAPFQVIDPPAPLPLPLSQIDLAALPAPARAAAAARLAATLARLPFDLAARGPLRACLLRAAAESRRLLLTIHHIAADGRSLEIVLEELGTLYAAALARRPAALPELPFRFVDFAAWERLETAGDAPARHLEYWRERLAGAPATLELPGDRPRPARLGWRGGSQPLGIPAPLAGQLMALGRRQRATPFMTLLAGLELLLSRLSGQTDLVLGTPVANRNLDGTERLVGCFVNTLALRGDLAAAASFADLLRRVRASTLADLAHQELPFEKLIEELQPERWLSRTPLFQVMFVLQGAPLAGSRVGDLALTPAAIETGTAKFDLTFELAGGEEGFDGRVEFSADLFDGSTAIRLAAQLAALLAAAAARPDSPLLALPLLSAAERAALLWEWNDSAWEREPAGWGGVVHQRIAAVAARRPEALAVVVAPGARQAPADEGPAPASLTYGELERLANRMAWRLRRLGVREESLVAVCLDRGLSLLPSLLGVHKAGAAYLPLDPELPRERLAAMIADARPQVVLAEERWRPLLEELLARAGQAPAATAEGAGGAARPAVPVLGVEEAGDDQGGQDKTGGSPARRANRARQETAPPPVALSAASLAYVLFTSGSTGRPKGVAVPHGALMNVLGWVSRELGLETAGAAVSLLAVTTLSFDIAAVELLLPLLLGGRVELADREVAGDGTRLRRELVDRRATMLQATPVTWRLLLEAGWEDEGEVRWGITCGEALSAELAERLLARLAGGSGAGGLWNLYGPTETAIFSAGTRVARAALSAATGAPLGGPVANTRLHVLDAWLQPLPPAAIGELYIAGDGLARGYLGRPELTAERFLPDPLASGGRAGSRLYRSGDLARRRAGGVLEYLGRSDHQVKLRGYRIELGEIEAALGRHPAVRECVVAVRGDGDHRRLVAWVAARGAAGAGPPERGGDPGGPVGPGAAEPLAWRLREHLRRQLPAYMVPALFVVLPELPHTPTGKVDRKALPAAAAPAEVEAYTPPAGPEEELLASLWAGLLGVERVGRSDDFFGLGGHSLLATRLMSRLREAFGVELPVRSLFEAPLLSALAERVRRARAQGSAAAPPLPRERPAGELPLSFGQERLWFLAQLEPESTAYHIGVAVRLRGPLDPAALAAALGELVRRHETLRTVFAVADGRPVQRILPPPAEVALPRLDLRRLAPTRSERLAAAIAGAWTELPFDLARGPLLRPLLVLLPGGDSRLLLAVHHIAADGWSLGVLVRELGALYPRLAGAGGAAPPPAAAGVAAGLAALPLQYADFACWQRQWLRGEPLREQLGYWQRQLAALRPLALPADRPLAAGGPRRASRRAADLPPELAAGVRQLARLLGATPFMVLLAGLQAVLARYAGQPDVAVGSPIANRNRAEIEPLVGFFVNTLVLRSDLSGEPTGRELLGRVREVALDAYAHQDVPFELLVERLAPERASQATPLFRVMLAVQNTPWPALALPGLEVATEAVPGRTAKFDLSLTWMPEPAFRGELEYCRDLFDGATVQRLLGHLATFLGALAQAPERRLSELPWLTAPERAALLREWNDTAVPAAPAISGGRVHQRVAASASARPEAPAVVWPGGWLSYGELVAAAARLAVRLRRLGAAPEVPVALCLERSPELVIAALAVLQAGAAYLPLDPASPPERLGRLLADAGAPVLVTTERLLATLALPGGVAALVVDGGAAAAVGARETAAGEADGWAAGGASGPAAAPPPGGAPGGEADGNLAYVIYTSGSTGRPKGVGVSHANLLSLVDWHQRTYRVSASDRATLIASPAFDASVWEMWPYLTAGASLHVPGEEERAEPARLLRWLAAAQVTISFLPTPLAEAVLAEIAAGPGAPPARLALRALLTGGDRLRLRPAAGLPFVLVNHYGPTETTVVATCGAVAPASPAAPAAAAATALPDIGSPIDRLAIRLLDPAGQPVPIGVPGEIAIAGASLARGYLGRPELTAASFVPDAWSGVPGGRLYLSGDLARRRADGCLEFLGRRDQQVKIRGVRIEPGEVEAELAAHAQVAAAVVLARADGGAEARLVAWVVPRDPATAPAAGELRSYLRARLPEPLVPSAFVLLPALPLTANGKIDRAALPAPQSTDLPSGVAYLAPRNADEEVLLALWSELLGADAVERDGAAADFFALGGHSLLATQLLSRVRDAFGVELPVRSVFECPSIAAFAARLAGERLRAEGDSPGPHLPRAAPPIEPMPDGDRQGRLSLSFAQERLWLLDQLQPGNAAYNIPIAVRLRGALDPRRLARCLDAVAARHESLRTTFHAVDGQPFQRIAPAVALRLPVVDLRALLGEGGGSGGSGEDGRPGGDGGAGRAAEVEARRLAVAEAATPFDLARGPLLRARLLELPGGRQQLLLNMHHIVSDGWSVRLLLAEVRQLYAADAAGGAGHQAGAATAAAPGAASLPPLPVQYADYAHWQRRQLAGEILARQLDYWRRELAGELPVLDLPLDHPRPAVQTFRGGAQRALVPAPLAAELRALTRREGASLFMTLLAGFAVLLHRFGGQEEVLMGVPIAGRHHREIEPLIGFFLNSLVLRSDLSGRPAFRELLRRVRRAALDAYAHQDVPFERLLQELQPERDLSRTPLFQVYFNFQNLPPTAFTMPGVEVEEVLDVEEPSKFDLTLYVHDDGGEVALHLVYNAGLFAAERIAEALRQYLELLAQAAAAPDASIASFSLVTPAARRLLPDPAAPLDDAWAGAVHEHLAAWARREPDRLAVTDPGGAWTYAELDRQSNRLAHRLLAAGAGGPGREDTVAIYAHRSATLIWAVLGTLKAGAAFVILDPAYPAARLIDVLRLARPRAWLEMEAAVPPPAALAAAVEELPGCLRLPLPPWPACGAGGGPLAAWPDGDPTVPSGPERLAYVAFTSGSTGMPKGVMGRHGPLSHFLPWQTAELGLRGDDRFSLLSGLSHDPLQRDIFTPLFLGAAICIPDPAEIIAAGRLAAWLREARVSVAHLTPAIAQVLTEGGREGHLEAAAATTGAVTAAPAAGVPPRLDDLRFVLLVGDVLTRRDVDRLQRLAPLVTVVNLYGSTETQRAVGYHVAARGETAGGGAGGGAAAGAALRGKEILPCGRGMRDVQLLVLGAAGQLAGVGELGEVSVRSPHLARGYLDEPLATAEKFLTNPFTGRAGDRLYKTGDLGRYLPDGEVAFAGRADTQVKIRGFRIELGEIEAQIGRLPGVLESVVLATGSEAADRRLVAFVVPRPGAELAVPQLRAHLRQALPAFMVPAAFQLLPSLPLTPNGKVDRKLLLQRAAAPAEAAMDYIAPRDEVEASIAEILRDVLKVERVGVEDNFFELGGNSLLLVQAQSRLQAAFHRELPVFEMFSHPTVRDLARFLGARLAPPPAADDGTAAQLRVGKDRLRRRLQQAQRQERRGVEGDGKGEEVA